MVGVVSAVLIAWQAVHTVLAVPSANIVYSIDGGSSWTASPTVKAGQKLLTRLYYNNDTSANITDAQINTALPSGFTREASSTRTCLNPGTTNSLNPSAELVCSSSAGMGGAINEGAVWSGSTLNIAPNAGVYGVPVNATSGLAAAGKKRYLNLHQCLRAAGFQYIMVAINDPIAADWYAGTKASNTTDTTYNCGTNTGGWVLHGTISAVQNLDLLGNRYVNMHQCMHYYSDANGTRYITTLVNSPAATNWGTGTNTANTANGAVSCVAPGGGWIYYPGISSVQALDTLNNRYVNIHECLRVNPAGYYLSTFVDNATAWRTGTKAAGTPDTVLDCPAVGGWPNHSTLSDFQAIDTLDTTRGQGFVEFTMIAPDIAAPQSFGQTYNLTGTGTGNPTASSTITVEPDLVLVYSTDNGTTWTTTPSVDSGASMLVRAFSHNKRVATAASAQVATALPTGFSLVGGSTKVCLVPGTTDPTNINAERLCNTDAGQGGVINEGTVWAGSNLAISPTAGLFGQSAAAPNGYLAAGKKKYVNLHQCARHGNPAINWITMAIDDPIAGDWYAGTNASNTADSAVDCGTASWTNYPSISDVQNLDLFGKRYANLHSCLYYYSDANGTRYLATLTHDPPTSSWVTGTNTSNAADGVVSCSAGGAWTLHTTISDVQPLDMLQNRYINLHECNRYNASTSIYLSTFLDNPPATGWRTGTSATSSPDTTLDCPTVAGWVTHPTLSDFQVLDTLDVDRGQVYVEFKMTAPTPQVQTVYPHTAGLSGTSTINTSASDTITVTVDPGVIITETSGSTAVTEGGVSDTVQVRLTTPPTQNVTINFTNDNGQINAISPVTFTPTNWDMLQSAGVVATDDTSVESAHTDKINYSVSSGDGGYNGLSGNDAVTVNITDNDTAGATITVKDEITNEDGDTGEFCIALTTLPSANVTIALSSADTNEVTVPSSITITPANWNNSNANCVTVTGADDGVVSDGLQTVVITTGNVTSTDPNYDALDGSTIGDVTIYNQDNDPPGFAVDIIDSLSGEDGSTATIQFRLLSQPQGGASVTIPVSLDDATEGSIGGVTQITITNANWNNGAANQVTITGVDDTLTDGNIIYHLVTGDPTSVDPAYDAFVASDVLDANITNTDNDTAGVTITEVGGSTNVTEGGATDTVSVVLQTQPAPGNQAVVTVQPQAQLSVGAGAGVSTQLTFTNANWNTPQIVTITANDDSQLEDTHTATVGYSIDAAGTTESSYDSISGLTPTTASITDNDTATVSIARIDDGAEDPVDTGRFRVTLSKQNSTGGPITINYSTAGTATSGTDYIALSGSVDIANGAISADIIVDTTGKNDSLLEGAETVLVTLSSTNSSLVTVDSANDEATVEIVDDEMLNATASLEVTQHGDEDGPVNITYQVVLSAQNQTGSPITFNIDPSGGSATAGNDYDNFSGQTMSVAVGATTGAYTVTVNDDTEGEGAETLRATISNPSLAGLAIAIASATANLEDDDTIAATIVANDDVAAEDPADGGEFIVTLDQVNNGIEPVTVNYSVSGSATAGSDFAALSGQVQIPVGQSAATITVDTAGFNDTTAEGNESVIVTLDSTSSPIVVIGTPAAAIVVISDSDVAPAPPPTPTEPAPETITVPVTQAQTDAEPQPSSSQPTPIPQPTLEQSSDNDGDGISDEDEDAAIHNGDGNGDGIPDKDQPNVASLISKVTGKPVTLAVLGDCQVVNHFTVLAQNELALQDNSYSYPHGLFDYELSCSKPGQGAHVTIYLDKLYDANDWTPRKFNRFNRSYTTVGDQEQFNLTEVGEHTVTTIGYDVTDGGDMDEDSKANGIILDPSGPGVRNPIWQWNWWWTLLVVVPGVVIWLYGRSRRNRDNSVNSKHR